MSDIEYTATSGEIAIRTDEKTKPAKRYTIRDIAEMAGVSRATVSLAMNGSPKVNARTREQVLALIERVGYRPNQTARNLANRRSGTILVILPKIDHVFSDVYFSECLSGIIEVTTPRQYHMMVDLATQDFKDDKKPLMLFEQGAIDGVLCVGNLSTDTYLTDLVLAGCPVLLVNSSIPGIPNVLGDNASAAEQAVEHLYGLGHRRIGHIRGPKVVTTAMDRTEGYLRALKKLGLPDEKSLIAEGYFDENSGYEAFQWLMKQPKPPTAIFTTNDIMALGALRAAREMGIRVPEDVALFGGDDIPFARHVQPPLSTIRQAMDAMGVAACEKLFQQMDSRDFEQTTLVPLELVVRESCGAKVAAGAA
ncbi:MAG: LacI family DNA-binding transcriptional regulator [Candidatus Sumerlaeaceae bacterium]